jgi:riboflavin synthase
LLVSSIDPLQAPKTQLSQGRWFLHDGFFIFTGKYMFSGIVETIGLVSFIKMNPSQIDISITPQTLFSDINIGDSVAVNGVCLTVTNFVNNTFTATIVPETMRLTNLGMLQVGSKVNLERSLPVNGRIGGHYVQGHIDACAEIIDLQKDGQNALLLKISIPERFAKYIVDKGYIAIDGMSITIIKAAANWFSVTLIPHTQDATIVNQYQMGQRLNLEVDILGKYVEKLLQEKIPVSLPC